MVSLPSVHKHAFQGLRETVVNPLLVTKLKQWLQLEPTTVTSKRQSERGSKLTGRAVISLLYVQRRVDKEQICSGSVSRVISKISENTYRVLYQPGSTRS